MKNDITRFCNTCDICQKTKPRNFTRYGHLTPNPIPSRPYQLVSMDFIVNLPWSDGYNAIHVVVDRLTKHATFTPTTTCKESVYLLILLVFLLFHSEHFYYDLRFPSTTGGHPVTVTVTFSSYTRLTHVDSLLFYFNQRIRTLQSATYSRSYLWRPILDPGERKGT